MKCSNSSFVLKLVVTNTHSMCNQWHKLNKTAYQFDHYLVLIIHNKINTVKKFTLCPIFAIGTRQKWPEILGTRQNLVLGSALIKSSLRISSFDAGAIRYNRNRLR